MISSKKSREKPSQIRGINRRTKTPKRHKKTHGNHNTEASIQTMKDSYRFSLPPQLLYGPPWAHYLGGYQDRLLGGPLGLPDLSCTAPDGVEHKDYGEGVLG
jgi:hypothetical protein